MRTLRHLGPGDPGCPAPLLTRAGEAGEFVAWLARSATLAPDPEDPPAVRSIDPGDDYLLALAAAAQAVLVSGDGHRLDLAAGLPIHPPAAFLALVENANP